MTIASEITRLQTAKADARTSIINKWVDVPANAKLDTYHNYIDLIQQWWPTWYLSWAKLYNNPVSWYDWIPKCWNIISFEEDWNLYGSCCVLQDTYSNNNVWVHYYTFRKTWAWDIEYSYPSAWYYNTNSASWNIWYSSHYKNWDTIKSYIMVWYYPSGSAPNYLMCWEFVWDYKTWTITSSQLSWSESSNPVDHWADLDWYTLFTTSTWVASATWNNVNDNSYIYLTLA